MHIKEVVDGTGKMDAVTNEPSCFATMLSMNRIVL
jgi:hypothetical protein